ncbi:sensor histidine kinase [Microbacterium sp. HD4P20]|uniref:sensor histidine kinase n=1 Tax=Microbacterium sp. HD4P20 TaxID=2864874 RepID=UPI001C63E60B|nr:sensor histidine kinase [Microbacterium sp. HD4P20]MCP2638282.1 sensor histidine kinase [Microbacterium sp. HD4P20]
MNPPARSRWTPQRKLAWASIACADIPAIIVLLESTLTDLGGPSMPWVWWSIFLLFILALMLIHGLAPRPRRVPVNALLVLLITLGLALVALYPEQGGNALLFGVVTMAAVSYYWSLRAVVVVAAVQTAAIGFLFGSAGWPLPDVLMGVFAYANFQVFGSLVVFALRNESEARKELVLAHAELRSTAALLESSTREAERLRIARDLHDLAGHQLTALSLELEVASHLTDGDAQNLHILRARSIAKELLETVRNAVTQMRATPPDLTSALIELAEGVPGLEVSLEVNGESHVTPAQTAVILRCVQESITNTLRHSRARSMRIGVDVTPHDARLAIVDDGVGTTRISPGHGLTGMRERVELLGGTLTLESAPRAGFTISALIPRATPSWSPDALDRSAEA